MKKSNMTAGILYALLGVSCLLAALMTETRLDGLLFGFAGGGIGAGVSMLCSYFYWSAPKNRERYAERLEQKAIEMRDELKTALRDRAGRYAYVLSLMVVSVAMVAFSVLGSLEVMAHTREIVLFLGAYLVFQIVVFFVIFNRLLRKY